MNINEFLSGNILFIVSALTILIIILFIMLIVSMVKQKNFKKRIEKFLGSSTERHNIESLLNTYLNKVEIIGEAHADLLDEIKEINERMIFCIQKIGLVRYNPFDDVGGDLSFALALLNEVDDGVIINNIYSRDSCYTYAKPIKDGKPTKIKLSNEEEEALKIAMKR